MPVCLLCCCVDEAAFVVVVDEEGFWRFVSEDVASGPLVERAQSAISKFLRWEKVMNVDTILPPDHI